MMKHKVLIIVVAIATFLLIFSQVKASQTIYSTTYLGIPNYGTYINFDSSQTFNTLYRESNTWTLDNYQISVQNANLTVNELFESPNQLVLTLDGNTGTQSTLNLDASSYGYTGEPTDITYTGDVIQTNTEFTDNTITLRTDHNNNEPVTYTILWATNTGGGGGGTYTPPDTSDNTDPTTEDPATENPIEDTLDDITNTINDTTGLDLTPQLTGIILLCIVVIIIISLIQHNKNKNKWRNTKINTKNF